MRLWGRHTSTSVCVKSSKCLLGKKRTSLLSQSAVGLFSLFLLERRVSSSVSKTNTPPPASVTLRSYLQANIDTGFRFLKLWSGVNQDEVVVVSFNSKGFSFCVFSRRPSQSEMTKRMVDAKLNNSVCDLPQSG